MNTIYPHIKPLLDLWDHYTQGPYLKDLEYFIGGQGAEWLTKMRMWDRQKVEARYTELQKRFHRDPEVADVLEDNAMRLSLLYAVDRHLTYRQAYGALKSRFFVGDSAFGAFQKQVSNGGLLMGSFRGILLNTVQFMATSIHPLFYSRGTNYLTHYFYASLFEVATYPLDTIKTILQADVAHQYRNSFDVISKVYASGGFGAFYKGLAFKLLFNGSLVFHLRNLYERDALTYFSFPLLAASYALLTVKTRFQLTDTPLTFLSAKNEGKILANCVFQNGVQGLYRGLVPFLLLNTFFQYNLYALYSPQAQATVLEEINQASLDRVNSPRHIKIWT